MKDLSRIENSEFVKILVLKIKGIYASHLRLYANTERRPKESFNEYGNSEELQLKYIFKKYNNLIENLKKLIFIPEYLETEIVEEFCRKKELEEIDYYQYHFENFLVRLVGLLDVCAKLGNAIYELKIEEKKCNWYAFATNKDIVGKKCCTVLHSFANYLDTLKSDRHIIVHAGGYKSDEIESIESKILDDELLPLEKELIDWFNTEKKNEISRLTDYINNKLDNAVQFVFDFLESMQPDLKLK